ncbi:MULTISPECIES: hypothetical protein [unclassified Mesorhizobium]|uniref:hypothetical protein n=1 Tax=unclassified Mesorhizobium TaxID=325217 RepID=UPI00241553F4|nr:MULTISPECIES: hypothetical protein [unclassified Mesorhizobium]MDG4854571.1 hypothetical protein [Mesorhizobium sp. WSM4982]MDG4916106.1 hypothetical protein [Mesorhizobium sp. WSM4983]
MIWRLVDFLVDGVNGHQFEHNSVSQVPFTVGMLLKLVSFADHLINELESVRDALEEQNSFAIRCVISQSSICSGELHCSALPMPEIEERSVLPSVMVSVLLAFFACHENDDGVSGWRNHSALSLSVKSRVNVEAAVVDSPPFEAPTHRRPPSVKTARVCDLLRHVLCDSFLSVLIGVGRLCCPALVEIEGRVRHRACLLERLFVSFSTTLPVRLQSRFARLEPQDHSFLEERRHARRRYSVFAHRSSMACSQWDAYE